MQEVNEFQKKAFSSNRNFNGNFFLTGILKCPKCGAGTVMSKTKRKNSDKYHLYYMCQAYHNKGKSVCGTNLIKKELVEQEVLKNIAILVNDEELIEKLLEELFSDKTNKNSALINDIDMFKAQLKKVYNIRSKLDNDYFDNKIAGNTYNRLMNDLQVEIECIEVNIRNHDNEITRNVDTMDKEEVINVLKNFTKLFEKASDEEKKLLIRALIKEANE